MFKKSANYRDLANANDKAQGAVRNSVSRAMSSPSKAPGARKKENTGADVAKVLKVGSYESGPSSSSDRVSIPFSTGFQYTIRPEDVQRSAEEERRNDAKKNGLGEGAKGGLTKKMIEIGRKGEKNARSQDISVEGRGMH